MNLRESQVSDRKGVIETTKNKWKRSQLFFLRKFFFHSHADFFLSPQSFLKLTPSIPSYPQLIFLNRIPPRHSTHFFIFLNIALKLPLWKAFLVHLSPPFVLTKLYILITSCPQLSCLLCHINMLSTWLLHSPSTKYLINIFYWM